MNMRLKVGCVQSQVGGSKYWNQFAFCELPSEVIGSVKPKTLAKYRAGAPAHAGFVVTISAAVAELGFDGDRAVEAWNQSVEFAAALESQQLLLRTPPAFRPTRANREALVKFVNTHQVEEQRIAWLAEGLWESQPDDVKGICADTGMIQVSDPLGLEDLDDLPRGTSIYWRLLGRRGLRSGFSDYELENLLELVMSRDDGHISFSSPGMLAEAKRFARILNEELIALDGE